MQALVAIGLLAFFIALVVPAIMAHLLSTDGCSTIAFNLRSYAHAVVGYSIDNGHTLPASLQALHDEDYVYGTEAVRDPYGSPYAYRRFQDGAGFFIASLGDDNRFGGDGNAADEVLLWDRAGGGFASLFTYGGWSRPNR
jgi:hypothetical protein